MEDAVDPGHRALEGFRFGDIAGTDVHAQRAEVLRAGRIADDGDHAMSGRDQLPHDPAADEPGGARHEVLRSDPSGRRKVIGVLDSPTARVGMGETISTLFKVA